MTVSRTRVGGGLIAAVGSGLAAFLVTDAASASDPTYWLVESYPIALSLVLAGAGVLLARGRLIADRYLRRLLAWLAVGVTTGGLLGAYLYALVVVFAGNDLLDTPVGFITIGTLGALIGLLVGVYDARAADRKRAVIRLSHINDTLRIATGELVEKTDRDALEVAVCERLTESDAYSGAWIGRYDADDDHVRSAAWAGLDDAVVEPLAIPVGGGASDGTACASAIATRAVRFVRIDRVEGVTAALRHAFDHHDIESMAVVPIAGTDQVYGVLGVCADQPDAFDEREHDVFTELGRTIGRAVSSIRAQERLRLREQELLAHNDRLDRFASVVSHDLRNPLNVILGRVEYMRRDGDEEQLDAIGRAGNRMEDIIEDLLALSRVGQSVDDLEPVSVAATATDSWQTVAMDGAEFQLRVPEAVTVDADRDRLMNVFENLFRNAVEHGSTSPDSNARRNAVEHGSTSPQSQAPEDADSAERDDASLTVRVGMLGTAATDEAGPQAGFFVADDGDGIPADERDEIFDHGYTTNATGTGFGLSIVQEIVQAHGWSISVSESAEGGARFEIRTAAGAATS